VAFVQYKRTKDAKEAIKEMNGMKFRGQTLKVVVANEGLRPSIAGEHIPSTELEAEEKGKMLNTLESRQDLMKKLTRGDATSLFTTPQTHNAANVSAATLAEYGVGNDPSCCLILTNMFDPVGIDLTKDPSYFLDIKDDVFGKK